MMYAMFKGEMLNHKHQLIFKLEDSKGIEGENCSEESSNKMKESVSLPNLEVAGLVQ